MQPFKKGSRHFHCQRPQDKLALNVKDLELLEQDTLYVRCNQMQLASFVDSDVFARRMRGFDNT